jgi:hypothetical protein
MTMRLAFGLVLVCATALLWLPAVERFLARSSAQRWLGWAFVSSRLLGWLACYVAVPGLVRYSDLMLYYTPEASKVLAGLAPYRDFPTSYGPVYPYLNAAALLVWHHPAAIALVAVLFEIAAVRLFVRLGSRDGDVAMARTSLVYLLNPAAFYWSGMLAYNSPVVLLFWVLALATLLARRPVASAAALAASIVAGKFLGVLWGPVWLLASRRRLGIVAGVAGAGLAGLLAAGQLGIDLTLPLQREGDRSTSGNLWFLAGVLPGAGPGSALWRWGPAVAFATAVAAMMVTTARRWSAAGPTLAQACGAMAAVGWLFMLLSKKSFPHYTPMFLLFAIYAMSAWAPRERRWPVLLAVLGAIGIVEPGLWNALKQPATLALACSDGCTSLVLADVAIAGLTLTMLRPALGAAWGPGGSSPLAAGD